MDVGSAGLYIAAEDNKHQHHPPHHHRHRHHGQQQNELPYSSVSVHVEMVDVVAEVAITYKFINTAESPIDPTFLFPLLDHGVLCDVEVTVGTERRIASDINPETTKQILERKGNITAHGDDDDAATASASTSAGDGGSEVYSIRVGSVPPTHEVTVKCVYVAVFQLNGESGVRFVFPHTLLPTKPHARDGVPAPNLRLSLSVEMHDRVTDVVSDTHPSAVPSLTKLAGGKAFCELSFPAGGLTSDLGLLVRVRDLLSPRAWTSVGISGSVPSRMSMLVLCPSPKQPNTSLSKEGEVVLFLDSRETDAASLAPLLRASLEKIPDWAYFNVWASLSENSFGPLFEQALPAVAENFKSAVEKIGARVPFTGDDSQVLAALKGLLQRPISLPPRALFFVTSMVSHVDEALKLIAGASATTRNIALLLHSSWTRAYLPQLISLNGGHVITAKHDELPTLLPTLIATNIHPTQSLSFSSSPQPVQQFPVSSPPLFCASSYVFFMTNYDTLSPNSEVTVRLGLEDDAGLVKAKSVNSQTLHRLGSYALLSELYAGVRKDLTPHQKDSIATVLYSPWVFQASTPKDTRQLVPTLSEPSLPKAKKELGLASANPIAAFKSAPFLTGTKHRNPPARMLEPQPPIDDEQQPQPMQEDGSALMGTKAAGSTTAKRPPSLAALPEGGVRDVRQERMIKHQSMTKTMKVGVADYAERTKVDITELEAQALDICLTYTRDSLSPGQRLSASDLSLIRSVVSSTIRETSEFCPEGPSSYVSIPKLKSFLHRTLDEKWTAADGTPRGRKNSATTVTTNGTGAQANGAGSQANAHQPNPQPSPPSRPVRSLSHFQFPLADFNSSTQWFEISVCSEKGGRSYMEDQYCILESANDLLGLSNQPRISFFGVFDGHSGKLAAEYTKINLPFNVLRHQSFDASYLGNANAELGGANDAKLKETINAAFLKTDHDFIAVAEKDDLKAGTTAVTMLLVEKQHLVISNVGDSEAVLCRNGTAVVLSTIHNPSNESEKARVIATGGSFVHWGTWRVNGVLAVTRSLGDRALKAQICANPDTAIERITDDDEFIILASDGLKEGIGHQEAVDFVRENRGKEVLDEDGKRKSISRMLVDEALRKDSKDNITALVVFFKKNPSMS